MDLITNPSLPIGLQSSTMNVVEPSSGNKSQKCSSLAAFATSSFPVGDTPIAMTIAIMQPMEVAKTYFFSTAPIKMPNNATDANIDTIRTIHTPSLASIAPPQSPINAVTHAAPTAIISRIERLSSLC